MWIKARPSRLIALLLTWWLACWWGTGIWRDKVATQVHDDARQRIEQFIATSIEGYERIIATRRGMLRVLARDQTYRDALSRHAPLSAAGDEDERRRRWNADPRLAAVSRQLTTMARDLGMRTIWLMDANGNCIASSNAGEPTDHVGTHYADRDYFQEARAGRSAHQVNIGRRQLGASISFSAPVTDRNGRVIGALAGGNDLSTFTNWLDQADAFFTDRHGVVILSKDPAMILRALPNAPVHGYDAFTREKLYKTSDIPTLNLPSQGDDRFAELLRFTDGTAPAILGSRSVTDGEPVLHVLRPLPQLTDLDHRRAVNAGTLGLVGILLFLLVAGTLRRRREQQAMALALAEREQKATQARDFLDQMVNAIPDPVFVKDRSHRWVLMNNAFCELVGQPREKLIGKSDFDFFPETQARVFWDKDELVFNAGIENVNEEKITGSQGDTRIIITKKSPVTTAEGEQFLVGIISDISARKQTERLLRAREREFRTLAENLPDIVIRYDRECRRLYVNAALATMAGARPEDLLGRPPQDLTPLVDPERYLAELRRAMDGGAPCSLEVQVRRANGEPGWYLASFVPEFDADGQVVGALVVARDITVRRAMEDALAARERELRTLMDNIPDLVLRYDRDRRRVYANPAWERTTGTKREEIVGTPPVGFGGDSKEVLPAYTQLLEDVIASGQAREFELQWPMRDGSIRWYHHRLVAELDETGAVVGAVVISNDVTERKRAERQLVLLKHAVEQSGEAFFLSDEAHRFIDVNRAACESLGYRREELLGKTPLDIDPDVTPEMLDRLTHEGGNVPPTLESRHRTRDGHVFPVEITAACFNVDGASYTISLVRDIGARKRIENTLRFVADPGNTTDFLAALARHLGETLGVDHVVIDRLADEPGIAETVALYAQGAIVPNMRYALADTPCANVLGKRSCCYARGVQALFPQDALLVDMGVDSYAGTPLWDSTGKPIGLIAVMDAAPLQDETAVMQILQLVAPRVAAELERAQSDCQLRAREQEFRTLAENLPVAVIRYDAGQHRRYLNSAAERMLHGSAAELLGHVPGGPTVPATLAMIEHYRGKMADVLATDAARELDFVLDALPADRQEHYEIRFVPEHGADGQTTGVLAIWYDITGRKRIEATLAQRERDFRSLAENLPDNMARWDTEGRYLYVNPTHERTLGVPAADLIGKTISEAFPDTHLEVRAAIAQVVATGKAALFVRQPVPTEDGGMDIHDVSLVPELDAEGHVVSVLGLGRDMTDIYRMQDAIAAREQEFRSLAESSPDSIIRYDLDHRILYLNDLLVRDLELASADEVIGKRPIEVWPDGRFAVIDEAANRVIASGTTETVELVWTRDHGVARIGQIVVVPERDVTGRIVGTLAFGRDITERKRAEEALRESHESLNEAQRVSHVGSWEFDLVGNVLTWSNEVFRIFEIDPRQFGASFDVFFNTIHPDDREAVNRAYTESLENRLPYEMEHRLLMADGRIKHVHERGETHYAEDGKPLCSLGTVQDITERKRLETELTDSRNFLGKVANSISDPVFVKDREHRWVLMNDAFCALVGQSREMLLGKSDYDFLPKEQSDVFWEKDEFVFESGETNVNEETITGGDGALRHIQTKKTPFMSGDGQALLVGVIRDITGRRRAEVALQENYERITELNIHLEKRALELKASREQLELTEAWYRSILQSAPDGMLVIDRHGVIVQVNAQLEIMFGYEGAELLGNHVEMLLPAAIRDAHVGQRIDFVASGRTDRPMAAARHLRGCRKDGSEFPVDVSLSQLPDIDGRVGAICAAIRDITERKRLEAELVRRENEFRTLVENSPDTATRYDLQCRRIYCNPKILKFMDVSMADVLGKTTAEYSPYPPDVAAEITALVRRAIDSGQAGDMELKWERAEGTVWLQFRVSPEFDSEGRVVSALSVGRDVTRLKEAELELTQSRDLLRVLMAHQEKDREEERKRIAWEVHEELGQNLMALRLNLSMLHARLDQGNTPMLSQFQSTRDMLDRSIQVARTVTTTLRPKVLDLGIVSALEWLADQFSKQTTIACELHLDGADISMSEDCVMAVFRITEEALDNVARHAEAGRVEITLERREGDHFLGVLDDGKGFDLNAPRGESLGLLGLQERACALGGEVTIFSAPGKGTVIKVRIPAAA